MALQRQDVPADRKWRVEDIFADQDAWEALYASIASRMDFSMYEGKLNTAESLLACLEAMNAVGKDLNLLGVYAFMRNDEDTRRSEYAALLSRTTQLEIKLAESTAFVVPELTALPLETLEAFAADPILKDYDYTIRCIIKEKPHVLSRETEEVLAQAGHAGEEWNELADMLATGKISPLEAERTYG